MKCKVKLYSIRGKWRGKCSAEMSMDSVSDAREWLRKMALPSVTVAAAAVIAGGRVADVAVITRLRGILGSEIRRPTSIRQSKTRLEVKALRGKAFTAECDAFAQAGFDGRKGELWAILFKDQAELLLPSGEREYVGFLDLP